MKRTFSIAFCVLTVCSLMLVGIANAGNAAYFISEYQTGSASTIDGKWTSPSEWTDSPHTFMTGNGTGKFAYKIVDFTSYTIQWIVEMLNDNTNNTGDYFQVSFDDANSGGSAPSAGDFMLEVDGHTSLKVYSGTGTGWALVSVPAGEITWANTNSTSMWSSTPHWILEIQDSDKTQGVVTIPDAPPTGMRVAAFDAANNQLAAWAPNSTANNPNSWGMLDTFVSGPIPEGFSLGVVLLVSSVAVLAGFYYLRKRPKIANVTVTKL